MVNDWKEQENDEIDVKYDGSSNTTNVMSFRRDEIADGGNN